MTTDHPRATGDRERAVADLKQHGYCIVENALDQATLAALRERLSDQAAGEAALGVGFHDGGGTNQRLWMLINKGKVFRDLILHPVTEAFMGELLGPDFLLSSLTANIARPGGVSMYLHTDQLYVDFWTPKAVVANIAWMIDGFTDENGGTRVVPGSHLEAVPHVPARRHRRRGRSAGERPGVRWPDHSRHWREPHGRRPAPRHTVLSLPPVHAPAGEPIPGP